jgi:hypothetical protein
MRLAHSIAHYLYGMAPVTLLPDINCQCSVCMLVHDDAVVPANQRKLHRVGETRQ